MVTQTVTGRDLVAEWAALDARNPKMSERTKLERKAGRARNLHAAATHLIAAICEDYGITAKLVVDTSADSENDWGVTLDHEGFKITDRWADFPSEEFRASLMLLGMTK